MKQIFILISCLFILGCSQTDICDMDHPELCDKTCEIDQDCIQSCGMGCINGNQKFESPETLVCKQMLCECDEGTCSQCPDNKCQRDISIPGITLPDDQYCKFIETGWSCTLPGNFDSEEQDSILIDQFQEVCETQSGLWTCYGMCMSFYTHFCYFKYNDAGKECTSSDQCDGVCTIPVGEVYDMFPDRGPFQEITCPDCKGTCAYYPLETCDWYFELNNGFIQDHTGVLCD